MRDHGLNMNKLTSAYNWQAYAHRQTGLLLLRENRVQVDTAIETRDGYQDHVHWQAIIALCPKLVEASRVRLHSGGIRQHLEFPKEINGILARKLVDCAYGQRLLFSHQESLGEFYTLAAKYQIDHSIMVCLNFAQTLLDINNCIQLLLLSLKHRHHALRRASYSMIRSNFKQILFLNHDFHLLQKDDVKRLLLDNRLNLDEDEELVWLAALKWISNGQLTKLELVTMYNRMVGINRATDLSLVNTSNSQKIKQALFPCHFFINHDKKRTCNRKQEVGELIRCLRFLRFKSVNAFHVMLSSKFIQANDELVQLVQYMMLRYIMRKKIPIDKKLIKQMLPVGQFEKIKNSETTRPERLIKSATKFIQCRQIFTFNQFNQMERGDLVVSATNSNTATIKRQQNDVEKKSQRERQIVPLDEKVLDKIDQDWLHRAIEPRVPSSVALLIGGWRDGRVTNAIIAYDFVSDKWFKLNVRLPEPRAFHASCSSPKSGQIFILGGTDGKQILNSVLRFNPAKDIQVKKTGGSGELSYKFRSMCPMSDRRCHLSGVFHSDGRLYALGGHNGQQRLRSGEWFDPNSNQWHPITDMTIARSDASACSHENKIFIAGGQIGDQYIQASVEFYKPSDNTWTFAAPMIVPRMSFKLVSHRSHLLAIGGTNGLMGGDEIGSVTRSVERYNSHQASWSMCTPMVQKRASFGAIQIGNNLIVVGGNGGCRRLKTCESLKIASFNAASQNPRSNSSLRPLQSPVAPSPLLSTPQFGPPSRHLYSTDYGNQEPLPRGAMKWIKRCNLPTKHSGFSVAVVDHLKNPQDFTYHGSLNKSLIIKRKNYWHRFKIIKRRKLIRHLKIALVVTVVILIM